MTSNTPTSTTPTSITAGLGTCLWFDGNGLEAAETYVSLIPGSRITSVTYWPADTAGVEGEVMTVLFELGGHPFRALNGGPGIKPTEAYSFDLTVETQDEIDRYTEELSKEGGEEGPCGWVKDRFGFSWQIVPTVMGELASDPDPVRAQAAINAMLGMKRIKISELYAAADAAGQESVVR